MEKVALALVLFASCAEPPPPPRNAVPIRKAEPMARAPEAEPTPSPPPRPMEDPPWKGVETKKKLAMMFDSGGSPETMIVDPGFAEPPPPSVGVADDGWARFLSPERKAPRHLAVRARAVWQAYAVLQPSQRTERAYLDAVAETEGQCKTDDQCWAEDLMRTSYKLQGKYASIVVFERDLFWALGVDSKAKCLERTDALRGERLFRRMLAGTICGDIAKSTVTGKFIVRDQVWTTW